MQKRILRSLRNRLESSEFRNHAAVREALIDRAGGHPVSVDPDDHWLAALEWLVRAQDATPDAGVARGYSVAWNPYRQSRGWQTSYPETTGYIIPTFFDAASRLRHPDLSQRAIRMADWEIEVQLSSGAVRGGTMGEQDPPSPAVFNTGQVILGWLRAYRETNDTAYLEAARRGGDFLVDCQDESGAFRKGHSQFARGDATTYCTRVAWSLCQLGTVLDERRYIDAGRRNIEFGLSMQEPNGWFRANCLDDAERPLLHTIAYAARGILEVGLLFSEERYIDAARKTLRSIASQEREGGFLSGRFARDWSGQADWSCLTGDAQTAIIAAKLAELDGDPNFAEFASRLCRFIMRSQNRSAEDPGLTGGIKGSFPFDGHYGRYELLNWPTKFFVDAMMLCWPRGELGSAQESMCHA